MDGNELVGDELEQLRARVAHLEALVDRLSGERAGVRRQPSPRGESGLDRRRMLRNGLGLSAAAVAGVGMIDAVGSAAAADSGDAVIVGQSVSPSAVSDPPTRIYNGSTSAHPDVLLHVDNTTDAQPVFPDDTRAAIFATADGHDDAPKLLAGVLAISNLGTGVDGRSDGYRGVSGTSVFATGVAGVSTNGTGVSASSESGPGLTAASISGRGIVATSSSGEAIHATSETDIGIVGYGAFGVVGNGTSGGGAGGTGVGATGATGVLAHGDDVGVDATSQSGIAVKAVSTDGIGLSATTIDDAAVVATSTTGPGLHATSQDGPAVLAETPRGGPAVHATAEVRAIIAQSKGGPTITVTNTGDGSGIEVHSSGSGAGVAGVAVSMDHQGSAVAGVLSSRQNARPAAAFSTNGTGYGVESESLGGVGGSFMGHRAAIRLSPRRSRDIRREASTSKGSCSSTSTAGCGCAPRAGRPEGGGRWPSSS